MARAWPPLPLDRLGRSSVERQDHREDPDPLDRPSPPRHAFPRVPRWHDRVRRMQPPQGPRLRRRERPAAASAPDGVRGSPGPRGRRGRRRERCGARRRGDERRSVRHEPDPRPPLLQSLGERRRSAAEFHGEGADARSGRDVHDHRERSRPDARRFAHRARTAASAPERSRRPRRLPRALTTAPLEDGQRSICVPSSTTWSGGMAK